ncbi:MAG: PAS domain S-box protein [Bacteroidota bacterium]
MGINFTFSENQFNRIFPFYILINQHMIIESTGNTLDKIFPGTKGILFSENYRIKQPNLTDLSFKSLISISNQILILECFNNHQTNLRGQIEYLSETNQLLFVGSLLHTSIEKLINKDLSLHDFAIHDPNTDLYFASNKEEITSDDKKPLIFPIDSSKENLKKATREINKIAIFPIQNPDPIIRIDFNGKILNSNPQNKKFDYFIFEEKLFRYTDLFKLIATKIDLNKEKWEFKTQSGNTEYSFVCIPKKEEGFIDIFATDISDLIKEDLQLDRLYFIIQQTHQSIAITDDKVQIEWVNNAFEKNTGFSLDESKGKSPGSLLQGKDTNPETIQFMRRQIRKARPFTCELYNYKKSGEGYWGRLSVQPIFDKTGKLVQFFSILEDITNEIETKAARQETQNRMSSLINNLQAGVLLVNEYRKIDLVNARFCEIFQLDIEPANLIGSSSALTIEASKYLFKDPDSFVSNIELRKKEKKIITKEILELEDGRILERDFIPIWNEGKYKGNLWVYTDITEIANAEKKLELQKIFYEEILDSLPADVAVFDKHHTYLYVNPKGIKDQKVRKWIIGKKDEDYALLKNKPIDFYENRRKIFDEVLKSKKIKSWEEESKKSDGSIIHVLRNMYPVINEDHQIKLIIGYGVDISYTKSILHKIEESEKKYRELIDNSMALITTIDLDGTILTANPIVSQTLGYTDEEIIGHKITEFMSENDRKLFNKRDLLKIKKEKKAIGVLNIINKNGTVSNILFNNILKEEVGKVPYMNGFAIDITNRIKAEEELKKAKIISEEIAQSKQKFLAHMSHEIRTPMNAIMGMTNQLTKTILTNEQQIQINIIKNASSNLLNIINEILDLSKIEARKLSLEKIGFEPKSVIGQAMQVMMHKAEEKDLLFTNSYCDLNLAEVLIGDPYRLNQILLNLVSNSIKFTDKGTVDISCMVLEDNGLQQKVKVVVRDTGKGMDEEFTKKLFKKYSQEDESTARIYGGTGLGMSICEELVHLMDGTISVESKKGVGTSISFVIPFEKGNKDQIQVKEIIKLDTNILRGRRVLIADDYEINRLVAATILNFFEVITEEAKNGIEAIEKIEAGNFDLVLMDVQMPDMDGIEATEYIRSKISKTLPIIALTAYALKGDDKKFIDAGMNDYLSKPFEENQLLEITIKWIQKTEIVEPKNEKSVTKDTFEIKRPLNTPLFDLTKIQTIAKGNKEFINKMIDLFINITPVSIIDMKNAYAENDFEKLRKLAHRIKPSVDNLEISSIKEDIREIELNAENYKTSEQLESLILKVEKVMTEVVSDLRLLI